MEWRTICPSNDPKHLIRGTELESCIPPGFLSRFRIVSVRTVNRKHSSEVLGGRYLEYDCRYRVYDAATVTDAEVRAGITPRSIGEFDTLEAVAAAIEPARHTHA